MRVLLLEDNYDLAGSLGDFLTAMNCEVDFAYSGQACLEMTAHEQFDIYILDIALPGMDGLEVCRLLRQERQDPTPIIFLTARDTVEEKIAGFRAGADDYLVKPFSPDELFYRIQAITQRGKRVDVGTQHYGDLTIDFSAKQVMRAGQVIKLHDIQFQILLCLVKHSPEFVSKAFLEQEIWGDDIPDSDPLRTHIYRLRNAIDKPFEQAEPLIETRHGKGYRFVKT